MTLEHYTRIIKEYKKTIENARETKDVSKLIKYKSIIKKLEYRFSINNPEQEKFEPYKGGFLNSGFEYVPGDPHW